LADLIEPKRSDSSLAVASQAPQRALLSLRVEQIRPGKFQPRSIAPEAGLEELKASIVQKGVIEPIIVRPSSDGGYELVAGERRWRAAQAAGLSQVPAIVQSLSDREALEYALIENVQRQDLNPWEEARGYLRLTEEFGYTQEQVAAAVGKDRATVANLLRTLKLPAEIQQALRDGRISLGHAKVLLGVEAISRQMELFERSMKEQLSVRQLEGQVAAWSPSRKRIARKPDSQMLELERALRQRFGTKVHVAAKDKGGRIVVEYFSAEDLGRIASLMGAAF
jgi:ParB family chromosome partitioning protein